jgi:hypothetical protein
MQGNFKLEFVSKFITSNPMRKVVNYDQIYPCAKFGNFWSHSYFTNGEVFEYWKFLEY